MLALPRLPITSALLAISAPTLVNPPSLVLQVLTCLLPVPRTPQSAWNVPRGASAPVQLRTMRAVPRALIVLLVLPNPFVALLAFSALSVRLLLCLVQLAISALLPSRGPNLVWNRAPIVLLALRSLCPARWAL